eukprot:CAMPEP_0205893780 /NCGR_PEP_ID=MMETSP1083-20121108/23456_1 /ASSEMBLY_ACC=CAM_ASM_000430 /TAXON_ID=97485 /ORGANISM="Prymnesium parvum, Strain Texoma1" /LENGTH=99 /DNA_ID=CAMNT_0053258515 /DNA_START=196 /DNA_END=492 /DNA_ORIENTATION=-
MNIGIAAEEEKTSSASEHAAERVLGLLPFLLHVLMKRLVDGRLPFRGAPRRRPPFCFHKFQVVASQQQRLHHVVHLHRVPPALLVPLGDGTAMSVELGL